MRQRRNTVPSADRRAVAREVARHLLRHGVFSCGQHVAIYAPFDGEIDLAPLLRHARRLKLRLYVPRIVNMRARTMEFVELPCEASYALAKRRLHWLHGRRINRHRRIDPRRLDVVLIPVVAFDVHGWRLGFGAGFYDRKLAFMRRPFVRKPRLVGIGYDFQRVPPQPQSPWDVPLHAIVTERGVHRARQLPIAETPRKP
jgi:5-formyltetrahydrofolate cyclo-ligase